MQWEELTSLQFVCLSTNLRLHVNVLERSSGSLMMLHAAGQCQRVASGRACQLLTAEKWFCKDELL